MIIRENLGFPDTVKIISKVPTIDDKDILDDNDVLVIIQDAVVTQETKDYIDEEDILLLKEAGPVFKGDQGDIGPEGPDLYHAWLNAGNQGSFEDFLNVVRQGLVNPDGSFNTTFTFIQNIPSALWSINHNMNTYPSITLVDSAGHAFDADYYYVDKNNIEITIISPVAGKAYLN
jgi:hypothetical protein